MQCDGDYSGYYDDYTGGYYDDSGGTGCPMDEWGGMDLVDLLLSNFGDSSGTGCPMDEWGGMDYGDSSGESLNQGIPDDWPSETRFLKNYNSPADTDPGFWDSPLVKTGLTALSGLLGSYFNSKNASEKATMRQQLAATSAKFMDPQMRARFMQALDKYDSFVGGMPDPGMGQSAMDLWGRAMERVQQTGVMPQQEIARDMYLSKAIPYAEEAFTPYENIGGIAQKLQSPEYMTRVAQDALARSGLGSSGGNWKNILDYQTKGNADLLQTAASLEQGRSGIPLSISQAIGNYAEPLGQTYNPLQALQFADLPKKTKQADITGQASLFGDMSRQLAQGFPYTGSVTENQSLTRQNPGVPGNWAADWLANVFTQGGRAGADRQLGTTQSGLDFGGSLTDIIKGISGGLKGIFS